MTKPKIDTGIYRHYKGNLYQVLGLVRHSETQEWLVLYQPLYIDEPVSEKLWVRPAAMFTELVLVSGEYLPRFSLLNTQ